MKTKNIAAKKVGRKTMRQRAFTLVEMLLVLTILAILAGIVIPKMSGRIPQAKIAAAQTDISAFKTALGMYEVDTGSFPAGRNGLMALIQKPNNNVLGWKGPYLEKDTLPLDPWNKPYVYEFPGKHNPSGFDIYSMGPTGQGGNDAIGNWTPPASRQQ
jgi:general secretion pathway protein G